MGFLLLSKCCIPGPHDFASVSGLAFHSGRSGPHACTLVSYLSPTLVSHTCLPHLSPTLGALGRIILHLSPTCLPHLSPTLVSHLSPICLPLVSHACLPLWARWASYFYICLPRLFPTLGALGRMILHLSPTVCSGPHDFTLVPHLSPTLVSSGSHDFTLVSHLSPTLVSHSGCSGPHTFTFVSHLSPTLVSDSGCSGPHDFTLVSHCGCSEPHHFTPVSHTCLPLWVLGAACCTFVPHTSGNDGDGRFGASILCRSNGNHQRQVDLGVEFSGSMGGNQGRMGAPTPSASGCASCSSFST